jgi:Icc protein
MIVIAHLSDTHFDGGERSGARAQQVMDYLNNLPGQLDAIVVTGDITDHGLPAEHEQAAKILDSAVPVFTCPGNHDGYTPYDWPRNTAATIGPVRLLLADSVIPGRDDGFLSTQTLDWLRAELASAPGPVLIGLHHPPVPLHHPLIDAIKLGNPSELATLIESHPQVVAVLAGHAHTPAASTFAGRPLLVAPGVTSTLLLPWEVPGELSFKTSIDRGQPPALAFHILTGNHLTTHYRLTPG